MAGMWGRAVVAASGGAANAVAGRVSAADAVAGRWARVSAADAVAGRWVAASALFGGAADAVAGRVSAADAVAGRRARVSAADAVAVVVASGGVGASVCGPRGEAWVPRNVLALPSRGRVVISVPHFGMPQMHKSNWGCW